ncbi:uncharacterized protein [Lepeophtheirus salmonis]|uniref:uncharacterized protein isoform X2 n=1 Tax=Lepeophtheirus salmonis TaxID=72036 RepID=UPI001AE30666|nr:cell wall protein DAN4-like isoform X2 [Lepeophtheirus salmonis]
MMQYCKYIQWMSSSSYKTFPISTLSIFVLLLSSTHGYPQGSSRNDTESNVTITTEDSFNTTLTTLPSQTSSENILSPSTSEIGASTNATTTPESSQETSFPPSTLSSSFVSNRTTVESSSTETSPATEEGFSYTDPSVKENSTTLSTKDTTATSVEGGENDSTTTITFPNTSTHVNNTNSTPDSTTNTLITDRNETYTRLEVGHEELLSTTPSSIFTTSTEHELVSNSFESSSSSSLSFSTPVADIATSSAAEPSTLPPEPSPSTPSNYLHTGNDDSLVTSTTEELVTLIETSTHTSSSTHSVPPSSILTTNFGPIQSTNSPELTTSTHSVTSTSLVTSTLGLIESTNSPDSSSIVTTTIARADEPSSTTILIHGSSQEEDAEELDVKDSTPYIVEEPIKTSKSPLLIQHDKGDGSVKSGMNNNQSNVMVKMEEKLDDLQYQIYALCGSFGVISLLLIILLFALAYSMSKLKDQVSSTRHVPYIPDNRTGDQIHAYDNSAFSTGHEMQERRRSNLDKEPVPKPGYGIHNGNNPYEKNDTKPKSDRHKMENIPLDTLRENEADLSQNKKPNTTDRDSKSTLMRYEDGVIPCNNDSTPPNGSMGRRPS